MLIVALVLAVIGLSALVAAVLTGNELLAWVCIAASAVGVLLLVVDAVRERQSRRAIAGAPAGPGLMDDEAPTEVTVADEVETSREEVSREEAIAQEATAEEATAEEATGDSAREAQAEEELAAEIAAEIVAEDHPEEIVHDEPDYDMFSDDEADYPVAAEEAAMHTVEGGSADVADVADEAELGAERAEADVAADIEVGEDARTASVSDDDAAAGPR